MDIPPAIYSSTYAAYIHTTTTTPAQSIPKINQQTSNSPQAAKVITKPHNLHVMRYMYRLRADLILRLERNLLLIPPEGPDIPSHRKFGETQDRGQPQQTQETALSGRCYCWRGEKAV